MTRFTRHYKISAILATRLQAPFIPIDLVSGDISVGLAIFVLLLSTVPLVPIQMAGQDAHDFLPSN